jgi:hypothetical protein
MFCAVLPLGLHAQSPWYAMHPFLDVLTPDAESCLLPTLPFQPLVAEDRCELQSALLDEYKANRDSGRQWALKVGSSKSAQEHFFGSLPECLLV